MDVKHPFIILKWKEKFLNFRFAPYFLYEQKFQTPFLSGLSRHYHKKKNTFVLRNNI